MTAIPSPAADRYSVARKLLNTNREMPDGGLGLSHSRDRPGCPRNGDAYSGTSAVWATISAIIGKDSPKAT